MNGQSVPDKVCRQRVTGEMRGVTFSGAARSLTGDESRRPFRSDFILGHLLSEGLCLSCWVKVKWCVYLYWITLSASWAALPRGSVRATRHGSSVTTGRNQSTWRKPAMLGRVKLDNPLLTCDQGNFNQITPRSRNRTLMIVVRDTHAVTVPPGPLMQ